MTRSSFDLATDELLAKFDADMRRVDSMLERVVQLIESPPGFETRLVTLVAGRLAAAAIAAVKDKELRLKAFEAHVQTIAVLIGVKLEDIQHGPENLDS